MKSGLYLISLLGSLAVGFGFVVFRSAHQTPSPAALPSGHVPAPSSRAPKRAGTGSIGSPQATAQARLDANYGQLPLSFEANRGQTEPNVKFLSRGRGYSLFLTGDEAVLALRSQKPEVRSQEERRQLSAVRRQLPSARNSKFETRNSVLGFLLPTPDSRFPVQNSPVPSPESLVPAVLRMKLVGANPDAKVTGSEELPGKVNYFIGNDPKKWRTDVPTFAKVSYENVYPGVDLIYYGNQGQLEYDFVLAPGADPKAI